MYVVVKVYSMKAAGGQTSSFAEILDASKHACMRHDSVGAVPFGYQRLRMRILFDR